MLQTGFEATGSEDNAGFWKKIWFASVPGKVRVHFWNACSAILPTVSQLRLWRVPLSHGCVFCNADDETIEHVSRDCPLVYDILCKFPELSLVP